MSVFNKTKILAYYCQCTLIRRQWRNFFGRFKLLLITTLVTSLTTQR